MNKISAMTGTRDLTYQRTANTFSGRLQDEIIMLDVTRGKYFALNHVATRIWELLADPLTEDDICRVLLEEYEVEEQECRTEVAEYLEQMGKFRLVTCSPKSV